VKAPAFPVLRSSFALALGACLVLTASPVGAFQSLLLDWQARYGATSPSGDNARCQLCHVDANGGDPGTSTVPSTISSTATST
jgi:hypothetical protein